jgi:hypothetical protein
MIRKLLWLALPLALCALVWGVKWRADHPTPSDLDLGIRDLMSRSSRVDVLYQRREGNQIVKFPLELSATEFESFVDCLYLTRKEANKNVAPMSKYGEIALHSTFNKKVEGRSKGVFIKMDLDGREGQLIYYGTGNRIQSELDPITTKRWRELLLSHPRIGPELRRRMQ